MSSIASCSPGARGHPRFRGSPRFYTTSRWALPMGLGSHGRVDVHRDAALRPAAETAPGEADALEAHVTDSADCARDVQAESVASSPPSPEVDLDVPHAHSLDRRKRAGGADIAQARASRAPADRTGHCIQLNKSHRAGGGSPGFCLDAQASDMAASEADETAPSDAKAAASGAFNSVAVTSARPPQARNRHPPGQLRIRRIGCSALKPCARKARPRTPSASGWPSVRHGPIIRWCRTRAG